MEFRVIVELLEKIEGSQNSMEKSSHLRNFLNEQCDKSDQFGALRLIIPRMDRERPSYGVTNSILAKFLTEITNASGEDHEAARLLNWDKRDADKFSLLGAQLILKKRKEIVASGLTIRDLNDHLDHFASDKKRGEKLSILQNLIQATDDQAMKWVVGIIVKDHDPCWLMEFQEFNFEDERFFTYGAMELLSKLRKRNEEVNLSARFTVEHHSSSDGSSVKVELKLQKVFQKVFKSYVSKVYIVHDGERGSVDVWLSQTLKYLLSDPTWTTLRTRRMTKFGAGNFLSDDNNNNALISTVVSAALRTDFFSGHPTSFSVIAFFYPHFIEADGFPHLLSLTVADLGSESTIQMRQLSALESNKVEKGFLFVLCTVNLMMPSDTSHTRLVPWGDFVLPRYFLEGMRKVVDLETEIPDEAQLLFTLVTDLTKAAGPNATESLLDAEDRHQATIRDKLEPHKIVELLSLCVPWIHQLEIERFVQHTCEKLTKVMEGAKLAANSSTFLSDIFDF